MLHRKIETFLPQVLLAVLLCGSIPAGFAQEEDGRQQPQTEKQLARSSAFDSQIISRALTILPGNTPVIESLDIQEYQLEQIRELMHNFQKEMGRAAKTFAKATAEARRDGYQKVIAGVDADLADILLPHQITRLKQVAVQSLAVSPADGSLSLPNLVALPMVQSQLELSATDISKLRELVKAEKERLLQEIADLQQQSSQRILDALTAEQQSRLREVIGEPFDFQGYAPGRGGRFRKTNDEH